MRKEKHQTGVLTKLVSNQLMVIEQISNNRVNIWVQASGSEACPPQDNVPGMCITSREMSRRGGKRSETIKLLKENILTLALETFF